MRLALLLSALLSVPVLAQPALQARIAHIAADARGQVAVACSLRRSALDCDLRPQARPPMLSVFKLPLAMLAMHQAEQRGYSLDRPVRFLPQDRILPHVYSPLQQQYPDAGVDIPEHELLRLAVSLSDNVAADILLRLVGGPQAVDAYVASLGVKGFHLQDNEAVLHRDRSAVYRNWFQPRAAVRLLRRLSDHSPLNPADTTLLLGWMRASWQASRIAGKLPQDTQVFHKSGTSDVINGLAYATNDIGLVTLPDGRRLAIAVFVTNSTADEKTREEVIARISRAAYDAALRSGYDGRH
jgi:beta-lactamase class A